MGLDNGIRIKGMSEEDKKKIPYYKKSMCYDSGVIEPVYWRKCYGLRDEFVEALHMDSDTYEKTIDLEDIPKLISILKPFLAKDYWDQFSDSIWEYEEFFDTIYENLIFLEWLKYYYKEHPEIVVYFYDSY